MLLVLIIALLVLIIALLVLVWFCIKKRRVLEESTIEQGGVLEESTIEQGGSSEPSVITTVYYGLYDSPPLETDIHQQLSNSIEFGYPPDDGHATVFQVY